MKLNPKKDEHPLAHLVETKNGLPERTRREMVNLLNSRLADSINLVLHCKQAHWNVRGSEFIALHKLFDEVFEGVVGYSDLLAERAAQLGGLVLGTCRSAAQRSLLPEYSLTTREGEEHVELLSTSLADFGQLVREAIGKAAEAGDADTADVLTEISRGTDKWLWMVESHQRKEKPMKIMTSVNGDQS